MRREAPMRSDALDWLRPVNARAVLTSAADGFVICFRVCNVVMVCLSRPLRACWLVVIKLVVMASIPKLINAAKVKITNCGL